MKIIIELKMRKAGDGMMANDLKEQNGKYSLSPYASTDCNRFLTFEKKNVFIILTYFF